jgi:hypothetical protein
LAGHDLTDSEDRKKVVAPLPPKKIQTCHEVEFYPDDAAFVDGFARTIEAALEVGNPVIVVATELHRASILERLRADAVDVDATIKQGSYVALDALATLPTLMASDLPDPIRCAKVVSDLIMGAAKGAKGKHSRVAICGEIAPTLLAQGNAEGAVRLEHLWDEITRNYAADTLCGYLQSAFPRVESSLICERICAEHSAVHGRQLWY